MQEEQRQSEMLYRTVFEQSPLSIQIFSLDGLCIQANAAWEKLWEAPAEALAGYNILADEQLVAKGVMPYIEAGFGGEIVAIPATMYDPAETGREGRPRWVEGLIYPARDEAGEVREVVLILEDVTKRKEAEAELQRAYDEMELRVEQRTRELEEASKALFVQNVERARAQEALQESEDRYRRLVELSPDGVIIHSEGRIAFINPAAARMYGANSPEELIGRDALDFVHPDYRNIVKERVKRTLAGETAPLIEEKFLRLDGTPFDVEVTALPFTYNNKPAVQVVIHDITERKRAEEERALLIKAQFARAEAEAAERRAAFLAEASATLAATLDYEATLKSIAQLAVPHIADWCVVHMVEDDGSIRPLALAHIDPAKVEWALEIQRRYPPDRNIKNAVVEVLDTGKSVFIPHVTEEMIAASARDEEHLKILRQAEMKSAMIVPLTARDQAIGAMSFILAESGRLYTFADLVLAEDLSRRCAMAIDKARLYRETQEALLAREEALDLLHHEEEQMALLVDASGTLLGTLKPDAVLSEILELARRLIAADAYAVWRYQPDTGEWRIVSSAGLSEDYEMAMRPTSFVGPMSDEPVVAEDVEREPILQSRLDTYKREGVRALLAAPLRIHGVNTGTITFYYHAAHQFSKAEVRVATALANLAASAIGTAELYHEQTRLRAEAEAANRMKDEFLATVSHELRTPLNAILGWAQMLRKGRVDEATEGRALEIIERNARSQAQIINDILDVSRIVTGKLRINVRPVDLTAIISAAIDAVRPAADAKAIELMLSLDYSIGAVQGDPDRLQQVVWNLLSNAIKFTSNNGRVEVKLARSGAIARIVVSDTGQGVTPEFLPHVFERFRQADSSYTRAHGGLGLGLAIVRHLVEMHGGTVQAESGGVGRGATFTVSLPIAQKHAIDQAAPAQPPLSQQYAPRESGHSDSQPRLLEGLQLLLVDDEPDTLEIIALALSEHGAQVRAAASAAEALRIMESWRPQVIVSDIGMPEQDGLALIREVRSGEPHADGRIPAIALTAYAGAEDRERALAAGFQIHLPKPVEPSELISIISNLAARS